MLDNHLFLPLLLCFIAFYYARRMGFFNWVEKKEEGTLALSSVVNVFLIYFGIVILLFPLFFIFASMILVGNAKEGVLLYKSLSANIQVVIQLAAIFSVFIVLLLFLNLNRGTAKLVLFGNGPPEILKNLKLGIFTWLIAYPFVLFTNNFLSFFTEKLFGKHEIEQLVLKQIKNLMQTPSLFIFAVILVVFIIPFIEELCFRGFLQRYLKQKFGRVNAIFFTSVIFTLLHFSKSQGIGNIELLSALFILSLFLGFLYEKQQNLFASYGLHAIFNGITVGVLLFTK